MSPYRSRCALLARDSLLEVQDAKPTLSLKSEYTLLQKTVFSHLRLSSRFADWRIPRLRKEWAPSALERTRPLSAESQHENTSRVLNNPTRQIQEVPCPFLKKFSKGKEWAAQLGTWRSANTQTSQRHARPVEEKRFSKPPINTCQSEAARPTRGDYVPKLTALNYFVAK